MVYDGGDTSSGDGSMRNKRRIQREIESLFLARQKRRQGLAHLSIEQKIRILLAMQKMAGDLLPKRSGGIKHRMWDIL